MKWIRFLTVLFSFGLCVILCGSSIAFAAGTDTGAESGTEQSGESSGTEVTTYTDDSGLTVNVNLSLPQAASEEDETESDDGFSLLPAESAVTGETTSDADDSSPAEGFPSMVTTLFGDYTPRTYSVTTYLSDGSTVTTTEYVPGLAGMDWPWIAGVALFALVLYCFFKLLGGVLRG